MYLPILALIGTEGKMFKPMAQTVAFALLGAFCCITDKLVAWISEKKLKEKNRNTAKITEDSGNTDVWCVFLPTVK